MGWLWLAEGRRREAGALSTRELCGGIWMHNDHLPHETEVQLRHYRWRGSRRKVLTFQSKFRHLKKSVLDSVAQLIHRYFINQTDRFLIHLPREDKVSFVAGCTRLCTEKIHSLRGTYSDVTLWGHPAVWNQFHDAKWWETHDQLQQEYQPHGVALFWFGLQLGWAGTFDWIGPTR